MEYMFHSASAFTGEGIEGFVTDRVTDLHGAFFKARALKDTLNLSSWNTSQVVDFSQTFYGSNVMDAGVGAWDTSNALNMEVCRIIVLNDTHTGELCHDLVPAQHILVMCNRICLVGAHDLMATLAIGRPPR